MKKLLTILVMCLAVAAAQTEPPSFPSLPFPLPVGVAAFGTYNQLGTPRFSGGVAAIYPVAGSVGVYGTTTADLFPKKATDAVSGRQFWGFTTSMRQGIHKDIMDTGKLSILVGGDLGPSFSQAQTVVSVNFSSSFTVTPVYQVSSAFSAIIPVRMLYVSGAGWNPVIEFGLIINLSKLPKGKRN